jgi:hypothetical protein
MLLLKVCFKYVFTLSFLFVSYVSFFFFLLFLVILIFCFVFTFGFFNPHFDFPHVFLKYFSS